MLCQGRCHSCCDKGQIKVIRTIWAAARQNQQNDLCAQWRLRSAWASPSLIRVFTVSMKTHWALNYLLWAQWRLWCTGWSESLPGTHHFVCFVVWGLIYIPDVDIVSLTDWNEPKCQGESKGQFWQTDKRKNGWTEEGKESLSLISCHAGATKSVIIIFGVISSIIQSTLVNSKSRRSSKSLRVISTLS